MRPHSAGGPPEYSVRSRRDAPTAACEDVSLAIAKDAPSRLQKRSWSNVKVNVWARRRSSVDNAWLLGRRQTCLVRASCGKPFVRFRLIYLIGGQWRRP